MKNIYLAFIIFFVNGVYSQNYFEGKNLYCISDNPEANRLFDLGVEVLHLDSKSRRIKENHLVFLKAINQDTTFCDAFFFAGYTLRLQNKLDEAVAYYYMADSLAQNRSSEFKVNLAFACAMTNRITLSRKKYNELVAFFPENPEGYYGIALTSTIIGDIENGLKNINVAIKKYELLNKKITAEVNYLKGVLLTLNSQYNEAIPFFEKSFSSFKNDDNYNMYYSLSLLKVSETQKDEKKRKSAEKLFNKIINKSDIPTEIKNQLIF